MKLKTGVKVRHPSLGMSVAMLVVYDLCQEYEIEFVLTSISEGRHSSKSKHYQGLAFDLRTRDLPSEGAKAQFARDLGERLGGDFDVVLEDTHIHVEWEPKGQVT